MYNLEISMAFIITELVYICLGASWRTPPGAGISRYIEDLLVTFCCCFFLWSGCCLFGTFSISILNFILNNSSNIYDNEHTDHCYLCVACFKLLFTIKTSDKCMAYATSIMLKSIEDYFTLTIFQYTTWGMVVFRIAKSNVLIEHSSKKDRYLKLTGGSFLVS